MADGPVRATPGPLRPPKLRLRCKQPTQLYAGSEWRMLEPYKNKPGQILRNTSTSAKRMISYVWPALWTCPLPWSDGTAP